jgi:hypothetical protein
VDELGYERNKTVVDMSSEAVEWPKYKRFRPRSPAGCLDQQVVFTSWRLIGPEHLEGLAPLFAFQAHLSGNGS